MLTVYHVPGTRSVRPIWLCYELDLPVKVEQIDFSSEYRNSKEWRAISPAGKVPALIDDDLVMFESGAMIDYILERYGGGRLHPQSGTSQSAHYRQWCWFAEATLIRPLGLYRVLRAKSEKIENLVVEAKDKFEACLAVVEDTLADRPYLLGPEFTAADIWMDLRRIELQVFTDNEPGRRLYERCGFEVEGTLRKYAFRGGEYADVYAMARLR